MSAETLLARLDGVRKTGVDRWVARCPAHDDRRPSLAIRELSDGRILVHDFGGCAVDQVLMAAGLDLSDLYPRRVDDRERGPRERRPFSGEDALRLIDAEVDRAALLLLAIGRDGELSIDERLEFLQSADTIRQARRACGLREVK